MSKALPGTWRQQRASAENSQVLAVTSLVAAKTTMEVTVAAEATEVEATEVAAKAVEACSVKDI